MCVPQDHENERQELPFQNQNEVKVKLGKAEDLLKDLFLDVDKAKKFKHPQATEIESEWVQGCGGVVLIRVWMFNKKPLK